MSKINHIVNQKFTAKDGVSKKITAMDRLMARFGRTSDKSFRKAARGASRFSSVTRGVVAGLGISRGLGLLSQGVGSVVTQFIAFDKAALGATVRFKDIGPQAANFDQQLKNIEASARKAGSTTQFTASQAAEALDFLARAGFTSAEAMASLESMINLSIATGEDFASVADKSSDLLGAFGLNADNTADKIANLNRLNDVLVKSANSANVTIETMFETMKTAAPIGRKIGVELEEVAAMTAILGNAGIKGTEAGTALKNMFLRLSAATPKTAKMLQSIGVNIDDGTGNMKKFSVIMKEVSEATAEFGNIKVAQVLDALFGKRAIAGAANIGDSIKQMGDFEQMLKDAGGTSKATAEIMSRSVEAKLKVLASTATEFGFKILSAFRGDAKGGIDGLAESIRNMDARPFIQDLKIIAGFLKTILQVGAAVSKLAVFSGTFIGESIAKLKLLADKRAEGVSLTSVGEFGGLASEAPNKKEAATRARQQSVNVGGTINVNAPAGTTVESTGPVGFNTELLGQN